MVQTRSAAQFVDAGGKDGAGRGAANFLKDFKNWKGSERAHDIVSSERMTKKA
jgi:hypothetical protein